VIYIDASLQAPTFLPVPSTGTCGKIRVVVDTLFQIVIVVLTFMIDHLFAGASNNSDGSEIGSLFIYFFL